MKNIFTEKQLNFAPEDAKFVRGIFHFTPSDVFESDEYSGWVNSFPNETRHILLNDNRFSIFTILNIILLYFGWVVAYKCVNGVT